MRGEHERVGVACCPRRDGGEAPQVQAGAASLPSRVPYLCRTSCRTAPQVPQYILEEAVEGGHGATCNIVVTQVGEAWGGTQHTLVSGDVVPVGVPFQLFVLRRCS